MNRFVRAAAAAAIAAGGAGSVGCVSDSGAHGDGARYRNWVDPCYPERYNAVARQEVVAPFAGQVNNGHFLHQTMWNWYFEPGTDKLNTAGLAKLDSLARERPSPDPKIYLQTARDLAATAENADKIAAMREDLTARRAAAIQKYLATQPTIGNPVAYEIFVHDAPTSGMPAEFAASAYRGQITGYRGGLAAGGGTAPLSTGGGGSFILNVPQGTGGGYAPAVGGGPAGGYGPGGTVPGGPGGTGPQ
ncbi:MAG TPA: hypothetical protein VKE74_35025 [Gemmataceae bacterium]|nr:hypothetical protein [Gemmataceae bacterium]